MRTKRSGSLAQSNANPFRAIRHGKKRAFLCAYSRLGAITKAARCAKINRDTHHDWIKKDPEYVAAFEVAKDMAIERLECEADRRGVEGVVRYRFDRNGQPFIDPTDPDHKRPYLEREYSDVLLIFRLKALRPDVYRERSSHELTGPDGGPINFAELVAEARARVRGGS